MIENSHKKSQRWLVEALTQYCFAICQCKTEEPKNIDIYLFYLSFLECWLFWCYTHVFPRYKMVALQAFNKIHGVKNLVI